MKGKLIVFERPDGVGKSTLAEKLRQLLKEEGREVTLGSFPFRTPNSLGECVYSLHHDVKSTLGSNAKQALHAGKLQSFKVGGAGRVSARQLQDCLEKQERSS